MTQISQPKYDLIFIPINRQPILPKLLISLITNCFLTRPKNTCTITSIRKFLRVWSGILSISSSPIFSWRLAKVSVSAQPVIGCSKTSFITCNTRRHYILMAMNAPISLTIAKMCFYQQWQNSEAILLSTNLIIFLKRSLKISLLVYTSSSCVPMMSQPCNPMMGRKQNGAQRMKCHCWRRELARDPNEVMLFVQLLGGCKMQDNNSSMGRFTMDTGLVNYLSNRYDLLNDKADWNESSFWNWQTITD